MLQALCYHLDSEVNDLIPCSLNGPHAGVDRHNDHTAAAVWGPWRTGRLVGQGSKRWVLGIGGF